MKPKMKKIKFDAKFGFGERFYGLEVEFEFS